MIDISESSLRKNNRININNSLTIPGIGDVVDGGDNPLIPQRSSRPKDSFFRVFISSVTASLASLIFGYSMGYTSPTQIDIERELLSKKEFSWFASLIAVGAIIGSVLAAVSIEMFGRKSTIMLTAIFYTPGWCLICYATNVGMIYSGRILIGVAVGMSSLAVPVYIAEVSSARLRGGLGSINQLSITCGILLVYLVGYKLSWKWTAMIPVMICALMVLCMTFMPETPRWSLANNKRHQAIRDLVWLRGPDYDAEEECFVIESNLDQQKRMSLKDFKKPSLYRPLIIGVMVMIFQQMAGINAVMFFCVKIFDLAELHDAKATSLSVACTQVVFTALACLIVDRSGRRILLLIGGMLMFACLFILGVYYDITALTLEDPISVFGKYSHTVSPHSISWLAVTCVIVYIAVFSIGWGPLPWVLMSELFPPRAKGLASGIVTIFNWSFVFIVTSLFHYMTVVFHEQGTFWFFAGWALLSFVYVLFFLPETKGRTLEQIEKIFSGEDEDS